MINLYFLHLYPSLAWPRSQGGSCKPRWTRAKLPRTMQCRAPYHPSVSSPCLDPHPCSAVGGLSPRLGTSRQDTTASPGWGGGWGLPYLFKASNILCAYRIQPTCGVYVCLLDFLCPPLQLDKVFHCKSVQLSCSIQPPVAPWCVNHKVSRQLFLLGSLPSCNSGQLRTTNRNAPQFQN